MPERSEHKRPMSTKHFSVLNRTQVFVEESVEMLQQLQEMLREARIEAQDALKAMQTELDAVRRERDELRARLQTADTQQPVVDSAPLPEYVHVLVEGDTMHRMGAYHTNAKLTDADNIHIRDALRAKGMFQSNIRVLPMATAKDILDYIGGINPRR